MSENGNGRRPVILRPEQKSYMEELQSRYGFTYTQARYYVLEPEQKQDLKSQIRDAERRRYENSPYEEIIKSARNSANSALRHGRKRGAWEFTITVDDLEWPKYCPVFPWIELHYPGDYKGDPDGASLDRIDHNKGYVPGNVRVVSLRANLLRKNSSSAELYCLANFYLPAGFDPEFSLPNPCDDDDDYDYQ